MLLKTTIRCAWATGLLTLLGLTTAWSGDTRPDIFFYLADDQNYWDYGFAGNPAVETPNADALSKESLLFTRAYTSMAICAPSRSSLYTGLYPVGNGCYMNHTPSRKGIKSVAHHLKELGYQVILAGKSHVKPNSVYDWTEYWPLVRMKNSKKGLLPLDELRDFMESKSGPVCLFFASDLPHGPYPSMDPIPEGEYNPMPHKSNTRGARKWAAGYYENIRRDDVQLGEVIQILKETGNWDHDVFFYASDHGIDGKFSTYDRGLRVPLLMHWEDRADAGAQLDQLVHFVDIVPTVVDIAGGGSVDGLDGKSLLPLLSGDVDTLHDSVYGLQTCQNIQNTHIFPARSITTERYKLTIQFNALEALEKNSGKNPVINEFLRMGAQKNSHRRLIELYDLAEDPFEQNNLADQAEYKAIRNQLTTRLLEWMHAQNDFIELGKPLPILKPNLHPLDKSTRFKDVPEHLEGKLNKSDYLPGHY
jgi:uncharacterized sulfatase